MSTNIIASIMASVTISSKVYFWKKSLQKLAFFFEFFFYMNGMIMNQQMSIREIPKFHQYFIFDLGSITHLWQLQILYLLAAPTTFPIVASLLFFNFLEFLRHSVGKYDPLDLVPPIFGNLVTPLFLLWAYILVILLLLFRIFLFFETKEIVTLAFLLLYKLNLYSPLQILTSCFFLLA